LYSRSSDLNAYAADVEDSFNYVAVLISIVIGLGVTRVLTGLSDAIQAGNRPRTYWVHTLWMINLFNQLMLSWWVFYRWRSAPQWTFFLFLWVMVAPTLIYLSSGILCPGELEPTGSVTWQEYYYANRRGFFLIFAAIWPLDVIDTLLKGKAHFLDQGPLYVPTILAWCAGSLIAAITRSQRYHAFWAIFYLLYQMFYATMVLLKLG
jgi:hypothetical protein